MSGSCVFAKSEAREKHKTIAAVSRVKERLLVWLVDLLGNVHPKWNKYKMYKLHPDKFSSNISTGGELVTADGCENSRSQ